MRLRSVSPHDPGWRRLRRGQGFSYVGASGARLAADDVERVRALAIPPAWEDVWICADPRGHLQAVGTDQAGRRQYLYHPVWRAQRDEEKHERPRALARELPRVRRRVRRRLPGDVPAREGVLHLAVMLIDLGCFRLGAEEYLEANGSFGLTTLELRHACRTSGAYSFAFTGKSGVDHEILMDEPVVVESLRRLTRRRDPHARLLAARVGREWQPLAAEEVNAHLRELFRMQVTAKDFRTWHGTVAAATALAGLERPTGRRAQRRQVRQAMEEVSELLGNTPAVARTSYVDPRVVDRFEDGVTIAPALAHLSGPPHRRRDAVDRAVLELLEED